MFKAKADAKNFKLVELVSQLRDHIDIHRIIGLNRSALHESGMGGALLGYMQKSAQEGLAMYICKIFEMPGRNELNSIPGIIGSLSTIPLSGAEKLEFEAFGRSYGNQVAANEAGSYLKGTFGLFCGIHSESLDRLKEFRDKIGAHSDSKASIDSLPSHAEFESLFSFAKNFCELVSGLHEIGPARVPGVVGRQFVRLMESQGVRTPRFDFEEPTSERQ